MEDKLPKSYQMQSSESDSPSSDDDIQRINFINAARTIIEKTVA